MIGMQTLGTVMVFAAVGGAAVFCTGCNDTNNKDFLGSAVVETQTYQIATTVGGTLVAVNKQEGQQIKTGELLAVIDTVPLVLSRQEFIASRAELEASIAAGKASVASSSEDVAGVEREYKRTSDLAALGSAPVQQRDNLQTQYASAKFKLQSGRQQLQSQRQHLNVLSAKIDELNNQLGKCYCWAPCTGVILTRFKNLGEVALPGNPIYEIGRIDSVQVDFFVPQVLLASLKLGQQLRIRLDTNKGEKEIFVPAIIAWISETAEFSPKNIQTRESRNELVFKVRTLAANSEGLLKRGLPVEVWR
ncbi:MAG: efflux RND transporter periplasmic adaptor subunit [Chitinivibrionales bacterium]|nr:efflux RND transporter periplasmic adaptor subunit [Chitinivibrionales bacterium]